MVTETAHDLQDRPLLILKPESGWVPLDLRELWEFRYLLISLARRDIKLRYRQTLLGAAWVAIQPLVAAGLFTFVFGVITHPPSEGHSQFLFIYAGLLVWNVFNNTVTRCSQSMVGNSQLISKVYFPRMALPLSAVLSVLVDFVVSLALMCVLLAAFHVRPSLHVLALPFWIVIVLLIGMGVGFAAAALNVSYRDVQHVLPVLLQFLMFASPVVYSLDRVPPKWRVPFFLNPLSGPLEAIRWSLLGGGPLRIKITCYAALMSVAIFLAGAHIFRKMERGLADVI